MKELFSTEVSFRNLVCVLEFMRVLKHKPGL